jgi:diguanylate cyclase (GGDEF)-like protein
MKFINTNNPGWFNQMNLKNTGLEILKVSVMILGFLMLLFALWSIDLKIIDLGFLVLTAANLLVATRMTLKVSISGLWLSFSDGMIFLVFLLYGGEAAIILSTLETLINCIRIRVSDTIMNGTLIVFNTASASLATGVTAVAFWGISSLGLLPDRNSISGIAIILGCLALVQFTMVASLVILYKSLKDEIHILEFVSKSVLSTSITQFVGAGIAGIFYKLIIGEDIIACVAVALVIVIAYFSYKQSVDLMNKSFEKAELLEKDKTESERIRAEQAEKHIEELNAAINNQGIAVKALNQLKDEFRHAALHDSLTGLVNRSFLFERLNFYIIKNQADLRHDFCVLFLDLHKFAEINESLGHSVGDKLLKAVSKRIKSIVQEDDIIARIGGDEFAIVLNNIQNSSYAVNFANTIRNKLTEPFSIEEHRIFVNPQIGIAPYSNKYQKPQDLIRDADIAMSHAKSSNLPFAIFDNTLREQLVQKVKLVADLRTALEKNEFKMFYQPLVSLKTGKIIGFEALIRWFHPKRGLVQPNLFIPILEDSGMIIPVTVWILAETCKQLTEWQSIAPCYRDLMMSVNISGKHLTDSRLVNDVKAAIDISNIDPSCLKLELTESIAMNNVATTLSLLQELKLLGIQLSIDDFGTGYSSLSQLHRLPFDTLKVDRSFVNNADNKDGCAILNTIVSLAHNLKMRVIAEGIETKEQLEILTNLECDYAQGYLFAKPLPKEEITEKLKVKFRWIPQKTRVAKVKEPSIIDVGEIHHSKEIVF